MRSTKGQRLISINLYLLGMFLALTLSAAGFWPDLEASLFDRASVLPRSETLRSLSCPLIISAEETGVISATLTNDRDREQRFSVRSRVSQGYVTLLREGSDIYFVGPGEEELIEWPISSDDAAFNGRLILARIQVTRAPGTPLQNSCGILVLDLGGLSGRVLSTGALLLALGGMLGGGLLWYYTQRPFSSRQRSFSTIMGVAGGLSLVSLFASLLGLRLIGLLTFILTLLVLVLMLEQFLLTD